METLWRIHNCGEIMEKLWKIYGIFVELLWNIDEDFVCICGKTMEYLWKNRYG